jgi:CDP-paratose 2-epimerase
MMNRLDKVMNGRDRVTNGLERTTDRPVLITGGAGFIGTNLADRLLREGRQVLVFDNLSRAGVEQNLRWLEYTHGRNLRVVIGDTRDRSALAWAVGHACEVFHFAAQVAVTTSLTDPRTDMEVNVGGTFNLLEALRELDDPPPLVYTSTNKVYGALPDVQLRTSGNRYEPVDGAVRERGIDETRALDFHTPYGCSKGAAEQYVLDYARSYGQPACVLRMSCIYGPHQFGTEDQGWVAHFVIRALEGKPITIYGDGRQVRDILFVEDLVDAMLLAQTNIDSISGHAFNMGGGPERTISLLELLKLIEDIHGSRIHTSLEELRTGDQRYYVSNTARFRKATGWSPRISVEEGVRRLYQWLGTAREADAEPVAVGR